MKFSSMRNAIVIASVVAGSVIPTQAFAQFDVFSSVGILEYGVNGTSVATYRFNSSMILNSIDFGTAYVSPNPTDAVVEFSNLTLSYQIGTGAYQTVDNSLLGARDAKGYRRIYLGELNVAAGTDVSVRIQGNHRVAADYVLGSGSNVSYTGFSGFGDAGRFHNSNLRVYNPGSTVPGASVAPEPGTFALALTGGAALIGVCIRRRRNAA
jgi:hypothetical protein